MSDDEDFYSILGVSKTATTSEIRSAYRKLAKVLHPDKNPSPDAHDRFVKVNEAYACLSDPEARKVYDVYGRDGLQNGGQMTPEQAREQFWNIFKVYGHERGEKPSAKHGAYVATVGAVTAPLKGAVLAASLAGGSVAYGGYLAGEGVVHGGKDFIKGVTLDKKKEAQEENPRRRRDYFASAMVRPVAGVANGTIVSVGGSVIGLASGLGGGIGGAYSNVKDGSSEMYDRAKATFQSGASLPLPPPAIVPPPPPSQTTSRLLLKDKGKSLWNTGMNES